MTAPIEVVSDASDDGNTSAHFVWGMHNTVGFVEHGDL